MARTYARMTVSFMLPQQVQATGIQYLAGFFEFGVSAALAKPSAVGEDAALTGGGLDQPYRESFGPMSTDPNSRQQRDS
jgi:hypothetical protein